MIVRKSAVNHHISWLLADAKLAVICGGGITAADDRSRRFRLLPSHEGGFNDAVQFHDFFWVFVLLGSPRDRVLANSCSRLYNLSQENFRVMAKTAVRFERHSMEGTDVINASLKSQRC